MRTECCGRKVSECHAAAPARSKAIGRELTIVKVVDDRRCRCWGGERTTGGGGGAVGGGGVRPRLKLSGGYTEGNWIWESILEPT